MQLLQRNNSCFIQISLKLVLKGPINNIAALEVAARDGLVPNQKQHEQAILWTNDGIVYSRVYASLGLNELIANS